MGKLTGMGIYDEKKPAQKADKIMERKKIPKPERKSASENKVVQKKCSEFKEL